MQAIRRHKIAPPPGVLLPLCLVTAGCTQLLVAAWKPPSLAPTAQIPGTYQLEPTHTQILFSVLHLGFTNYYGRFSGAQGWLRFNPQNPTAMAVSVTVPTASISTTSEVLDAELKSPAWLDAAHYPTMSFTSTAVTQTGPTTADVAGTLTLHGVTRPLTLHATYHGEGRNPLDFRDTVGFQITGTLNRSDYGITAQIPLVSDQVQLILAAPFEK